MKNLNEGGRVVRKEGRKKGENKLSLPLYLAYSLTSSFIRLLFLACVLIVCGLVYDCATK